MVSKNQTKFIINLQQKKYRNAHQLFVAEGPKVVHELIEERLKVKEMYTTDKDLAIKYGNYNIQTIADRELKKLSTLTTPNKILAVFEIPKPKTVSPTGLVIALDDVRDPGNLGTIIRLCDWFGINDLVCSTATVDCYNAKVVQATMGSLARVNIHYMNLTTFIKNDQRSTFSTAMDGDSIYAEALPNDGIIILGNEANGISNDIFKASDKILTIPRFGSLRKTESLNVATATAIILNEFKRQSLK